MNVFDFLVLVPAIYHAMSVGALDPHNPFELPKKWVLCIKTGIAVLALLALPALATQNPPSAAIFWGSFVLGQLIAPAFTAGDRYRKDEMPDPIRRMWVYWQSVISGGILLKILCIVLFFATDWILGRWWFIPILALASFLIMGRVFTAHIMLQNLTAEQTLDPKKDRNEQIARFMSAAGFGMLGFIVCSVFIGVFVFSTVPLPAFSWWSWTGVLLGATLNILNSL